MNNKWIIASDLHGSAYYCKLLLERFAEEQACRLIFLGDLLYHGPRNDLPRDYDTKAVTKIVVTGDMELYAGWAEIPAEETAEA